MSSMAVFAVFEDHCEPCGEAIDAPYALVRRPDGQFDAMCRTCLVAIMHGAELGIMVEMSIEAAEELAR